MLRDLLIPGRRVVRTRQAEPATLARNRAMGDDEATADAEGLRTLLTSSDAPCAFRDKDGVYHEILSHAPGACDTRACRSVLLHHSAPWIVGAVRSVEFPDGHRSVARVAITKSAKLPSDTSVDEAVSNGSLRGVSTGYEYMPEDADVDERARTITVRKWRMGEITLTPIPRDVDSLVLRSFSELFTRSNSNPLPRNRGQEHSMKLAPELFLRLQEENPNLAKEIGRRAMVLDQDEATITAWISSQRAALDETARADAIRVERERAAIIKALVPLAESHNLRASDYLADVESGKHKTLADVTTKMLADKAAIEAKRSTGFRIPGTESGGGLTVTTDEGDKWLNAATDALLVRTGVMLRDGGRLVPYGAASKTCLEAAGTIDLGARRLDFHSIIKRSARLMGSTDVGDWTKEEVADFFMRSGPLGTAAKTAQFRNQRAGGPNQVQGLFPTLLANVFDKALVLGFQNYDAITYDKWCGTRLVADFKQFNTAGATMGDLRKNQSEGAPLGELTIKDGGYNAQLSMWGGSVKLSFEAITSDDLGAFWTLLGQVGMIAKRTMDKEAYNQLMGAVYASGRAQGYNDKTIGAIATAGIVDTARADFRHKHGPGGNNMGNTPAFLLHPIGLARAADQALGRSRPPGEQSYLAGEESRRTIQPLECVYLDDTTVNANASATTSYLVGDRTVNSVVIGLLESMQVPQMQEFDAGAAAARYFKIFLPFVATVATYTDDLANANRILGIQQIAAA